MAATALDDDRRSARVDPRPVTQGTDESAERRIIDATVRCVARWGVTKTTLDDIAREAGCSRATVYRTFPGGKEVVVSAVVATEIERFAADLTDHLARADDLETLLVVAIGHSYRTLRAHPALQFLLAHEPEVVLPHVSFSHYDQVLAGAVALGTPWLEPHVGAVEAPRAAEWVARIVLSYALSPGGSVDLGDDESVRRLVRTYLLPGLVPADVERHDPGQAPTTPHTEPHPFPTARRSPAPSAAQESP